MQKNVTRRGFLGAAAATGIAACLAGCSPAKKESGEQNISAAKPNEDWLGEAPQIAESDIKETLDTDILIVGAGSAGLIAAAIAADKGADFAICEKTGSVQASRHWVGGVNTKWHKEAGLSVDGNKLLNEMTRYASGRCDQSVWKVWIDESSDAISDVNDVMEKYGFSLYLDTEGYDTPSGGTDYYVPAIQHMWYDEAAGGPSPLAGDMSSMQRNQVMEKYLGDMGYGIKFNHELILLEKDDSGAVVAGIFNTEDGLIRINAAKGILLATGGYGANPLMVQALNPITPEATTMNTAMPNCTGDGIRIGLHAGASMDTAPATMIFDRGITSAGVNAGYIGTGSEAAFPESGGATDGMVVGSLALMKVNRHGKRFMNESAPYDWCAFAATKQPGGVWAAVFDSSLATEAASLNATGCAKTAVSLLSMGPVEKVFEQHIQSGKLVVADSIGELAGKLGLPTDDFTAEVERYNELCASGVDSDFGKEAYRMKPLAHPPYYGFWCGGQFLTTLDGLSIDKDMRVLDEKRDPIAGLYAAGDCAGSLYSGNYPEYIVGNRQGSAITFARHAVLHMLNE